MSTKHENEPSQNVFVGESLGNCQMHQMQQNWQLDLITVCYLRASAYIFVYCYIVNFSTYTICFGNV